MLKKLIKFLNLPLEISILNKKLLDLQDANNELRLIINKICPHDYRVGLHLGGLYKECSICKYGKFISESEYNTLKKKELKAEMAKLGTK